MKTYSMADHPTRNSLANLIQRESDEIAGDDDGSELFSDVGFHLCSIYGYAGRSKGS
jgi:hypothetical protein